MRLWLICIFIRIAKHSTAAVASAGRVRGAEAHYLSATKFLRAAAVIVLVSLLLLLLLLPLLLLLLLGRTALQERQDVRHSWLL
jgi:hypothetical protein